MRQCWKCIQHKAKVVLRALSPLLPSILPAAMSEGAAAEAADTPAPPPDLRDAATSPMTPRGAAPASPRGASASPSASQPPPLLSPRGAAGAVVAAGRFTELERRLAALEKNPGLTAESPVGAVGALSASALADVHSEAQAEALAGALRRIQRLEAESAGADTPQGEVLRTAHAASARALFY